MKAVKFVLSNAEIQRNALRMVSDAPADGSITVTISKTGSRSARQNALYWLWNQDVAMSGIGGAHEASKDSVHRFAKYKFGLSIWVEDGDFADLFLLWSTKHIKNPAKMIYFIDNHCSTADFTVNQMAQYMTEYQFYYSALGVNLTDPAVQGLGLLDIAV